MSDPDRPLSLDRRAFGKLAAATTVGFAAGAAPAQDPDRRDPPTPPPPNGHAPAVQFQAAPGGTGAWLQHVAAVPPDPAIEIEPWRGAQPGAGEDLAFLPVHRLAALIAAGDLSPVDLTEVYLERLKRLDAQLLCVVTLMEEQARAAAAAAEREIAAGRYRGPLHGIPWGVKDLFATRGVPTTWGAKPFEQRVIDADAAVVERLREAGAILIAKLSLGTFARGDTWYRGRTRNPWRPESGSSGSSAGSAAATAAGCVGFAVGTETRGSIVSPARRCGVTALRPTFGRISRHGAMTLSWSMDKVGPMGRTALDCALVFRALHGADPRDPATVTAPFRWQPAPDFAALRIGYTEDTDEAFLEKLRELGARPRPIGERPSARGVGDILGIESAAAFDDFLSQGLDQGMMHRDRVEAFREARAAPALDYLHAQRRRLVLMQEMAAFMADLDLYATPSGDVGLTNLTGHPAAVFRCGFEDGLPRSIQLVGRLFADDLLLSVAHAYQSATDWHTRRPELS